MVGKNGFKTVNKLETKATPASSHIGVFSLLNTVFRGDAAMRSQQVGMVKVGLVCIGMADKYFDWRGDLGSY